MRICPNCNAEVDSNFELCWNCQYCFPDKKVLEERDFKQICPGCGAEVESSLNYCPKCQYEFKKIDEDYISSMYPKHIECMRCNVELEFQGTFKFPEAKVGNSSNMFDVSFDVYNCPICKKVELFLPEVDI